MNLPELIEQYGYLAVTIGTLLEGEAVLLLAGFAAHQGFLQLHYVIAIAAVCSFIGDQVWFYLGRRHGARLLAKYPKYAAPVARAQALLDRHHTPIILAIRFLYGFRMLLPFVIGMGKIPALRFRLLDLCGALIWAVLVGAAGYIFGQAVELFLGDLKKYEAILFAALAVAGIGYWLYSRRRASQ